MTTEINEIDPGNVPYERCHHGDGTPIRPQFLVLKKILARPGLQAKLRKRFWTWDGTVSSLEKTIREECPELLGDIDKLRRMGAEDIDLFSFK